MTEKLLVPIYLPGWLHRSVLKAKRAMVPAAQRAPAINIWGERNVEWTFLSAEMPPGPGEALEFGCEQGYLSLLAACRGFHVTANDLENQSFAWKHSQVDFVQGDFLKLDLPRNHFDLAINCSSVEHVGVPGRYGITREEEDGDIEVMGKLAGVLKPGGTLLMTAPCGIDSVMSPWCRVYGAQRLPRLFARFGIKKELYWIKDPENRWTACDRSQALNFQPVYDPSDPHGCAYSLGAFVLVSKQFAQGNGAGEHV
jgi:SAM-dependent methyltransferase